MQVSNWRKSVSTEHQFPKTVLWIELQLDSLQFEISKQILTRKSFPTTSVFINYLASHLWARYFLLFLYWLIYTIKNVSHLSLLPGSYVLFSLSLSLTEELVCVSYRQEISDSCGAQGRREILPPRSPWWGRASHRHRSWPWRPGADPCPAPRRELPAEKRQRNQWLTNRLQQPRGQSDQGAILAI